MNPGPNRSQASIPDDLKHAYGHIGPELREVENTMRRELSGDSPFVDEVIRYGFQLGGKRLRPALVLLVGKSLGSVDSNHYRTAAAMEIIHTATLIHDDILDGARFRRHLETVNCRWDSTVAVLAGDVLFTKAMQLTTLSDDIFEYQTVAEAIRITCEAELQQVGTKRNFDLTEEEYFSIVSGKTATLISCCCKLSAYFSKADDSTVKSFAMFGEKLGIAFQIVDDILDLVGEEDVAGKTLGTDIIEGKLTLPMIHYLRSANSTDVDGMLSLLKREDKPVSLILEISKRLCESKAIDSAKQEASRLIESALKHLPDDSTLIKDLTAITGLTEIANFVVRRTR